MDTAPLGYFIRPDPDQLFVEAWCAWALPFMNRTAIQSRYRNELREALQHLTVGAALRATHTSEHLPNGPDVENLLFYNVGTAAFRQLASKALRFDRLNAPPPEPQARLDFSARHHVRYEVEGTTPSPFRHTTGDDFIAAAVTICTAPKQIKDLASLWWSFKTGMVLEAGRSPMNGKSFGVRFTISAPASLQLNLTEVVKPLTDAFISALHCYHGVQLEEVARRVSLRLGCIPEVARGLLLDDRVALLGPRAVPHLRSQGVQWSPADDNLVTCEIAHEFSHDGSITIRGCLFGVGQKASTTSKSYKSP